MPLPPRRAGAQLLAWVLAQDRRSATADPGDRPGQGWEAVVICHGARRSGYDCEWNGGGHCVKWDGPPATWKGPSRDHGDLSATKLVDGQKPEWLIEDLILSSATPAGIVSICYCGSGTTVCALRNDRSFVGFERIPRAPRKAIAQLRTRSARAIRCAHCFSLNSSP